MAPDELQGLLAQVVAGVAGGTERVWRGKVGPVAKLQIALHPRSNRAVSPLCPEGGAAVVALGERLFTSSSISNTVAVRAIMADLWAGSPPRHGA